MASRERLDELRKSMRSRAGYVKNRTKYLIALDRAKRVGKVSDTEFKELRGEFEAVTEQQKAGQVEKLIEAPDSKIVGSAKTTELAVRSRPVVSDQAVQQEQRRQANIEAGFYSMDEQQQPNQSRAQIMAEQTALRAGGGFYTRAPLTSRLQFEKKESIPEPKPTGLKKFYQDLAGKTDNVYYNFKYSASKNKQMAAPVVDFAGGAVQTVVYPVAYPKETLQGLGRAINPFNWKKIGGEIVTEAKTRPFRLAGSMAGSYALTKAGGAALRTAGKGAKSASIYLKQLDFGRSPKVKYVDSFKGAGVSPPDVFITSVKGKPKVIDIEQGIKAGELIEIREAGRIKIFEIGKRGQRFMTQESIFKPQETLKRTRPTMDRYRSTQQGRLRSRISKPITRQTPMVQKKIEGLGLPSVRSLQDQNLNVMFKSLSDIDQDMISVQESKQIPKTAQVSKPAQKYQVGQKIGQLSRQSMSQVQDQAQDQAVVSFFANPLPPAPSTPQLKTVQRFKRPR